MENNFFIFFFGFVFVFVFFFWLARFWLRKRDEVDKVRYLKVRE